MRKYRILYLRKPYMEKRKPIDIKRILKYLLIAAICVGILCGAVLAVINIIVVSSINGNIISKDDASLLENVDCIIVLGCKVKDDGTPSHMLQDRLDFGCELYEMGAAPKLLMSGDHGRTEYDEVNNMKNYAMDKGIASEDIFMDHAGFSTYDSMYRARDIFGCKKVIIVTQEYHLYRALYIAKKLGLEAYGVASDPREYSGQTARDLREVLARTKDFFMVLTEAKPVYLGEAIPISGDGNSTNG